MRVATLHGPRDIRLEDRPEPVLEEPTDALVRTTAACICGSDLWPYRGENEVIPGEPIGHELIGVVEEVGADVRDFRPGDHVVVPFCHCDNSCPNCLAGAQSACVRGAITTGGQGELVRATQADGSLVRIASRGEAPDARLLPGLLTLSDVFPTGWHCAVSAGVRPGDTVVGAAPVRRYLPELLEVVTSGKADPGRVFDLVLPLEEVAEGYRAMDERRAVKVFLEV